MATSTKITLVKNVGDVLISNLSDNQTLVASGGVFINSTPAQVTGLSEWTTMGSCTYQLPNSFRATGNYTTLPTGTRIRLKQGAGFKYYALIYTSDAGGGFTDLVVTGGDDYTIANSSITEPAYSILPSPTGFPSWFNYNPPWGTSGTQPAIVNGSIRGFFRIDGPVVTLSYKFLAGSSTTFGTGRWQFNLPVAAYSDDVTRYFMDGTVFIQDASTGAAFIYAPLIIDAGTLWEYSIAINPAGSTVSTITNTSPFTWASGDILQLNMQYPIY